MNNATKLDEAMAAAATAESELDAAQATDEPEAIAQAKAVHLRAQAALDAAWEAARAEEQAA